MPKFDDILSDKKNSHILENVYPELENLVLKGEIEKDAKFDQIKMHYFDKKKLKKNNQKASRSELRFLKLLQNQNIGSFE